MHKVYVYGTLRPGNLNNLHIIPGVMYDLGWYPGVHLKEPEEGSFFIAETVEVDDAGLARLDQYEGYHEDAPGQSLYIRLPYKDGWIYQYNSDCGPEKRIENGDWLKYSARERGSAASMVATNEE